MKGLTKKIRVTLLILCFLACCIGCLGLFLPQIKIITPTDTIDVKGYEVIFGIKKLDGGDTGFSIWGISQYLFLAIGLLYAGLFLLDELFGDILSKFLVNIQKHKTLYVFLGVLALVGSIVYATVALGEVEAEMVWTGSLSNAASSWKVEANLFGVSMLAQYISCVFMIIYFIFVFNDGYYKKK